MTTEEQYKLVYSQMMSDIVLHIKHINDVFTTKSPWLQIMCVYNCVCVNLAYQVINDSKDCKAYIRK